MDTNSQIVGVDHGNMQIKTAHTCFTTGIAPVIDIPIVYDNILDFNNKFYRIGGDRNNVQEDKVCNENFYLLTLAAISILRRERSCSVQSGFQYQPLREMRVQRSQAISCSFRSVRGR